MSTFSKTRPKALPLLVGTTMALATLSPALAQAEDDKVLMGFSHAGFDALFDDANDRGLKQAIEMVMPRFMELRNSEAPFARDLQQVPVEMLQAVSDMIGAPMHLVVTGSTDADPDTGAPVFHALISFDMDKEQADRMHQTVQQFTQMAGQGGPEFVESERYLGMMETFTPMGPISFGPRQANDGWRYEILFGPDNKPDMMRGMLPVAPRGVTQLASGVVDLEALTPLTSMGTGFLAMASPQGAQAAEHMRESGLLGEGAMKFELTSWTDGNTDTTQVISRRARNFREGMYLPDSVLTPADLAIIPADATAASIAKFSPEMMLDGMLEQITASMPDAQDQIDEALAMIKQEMGIDVMGEFVPSLGDTVAMYFSDSTGGGSLLSGVIAMKSADKAKLNEIIQRVEGVVAQQWAQNDPSGGVIAPRAIRSSHNGNTMVTYSFSGLPVPIAPTMTVIGDWFVMGMSPQAAMAAADHTGRRNGRGLLDNPRFAKAYKAQPDTMSISFVDTERTLRDGYSTMNMLGMALGNLVSSGKPDGPYITSVVPPLGSMLDGCQPFIQQSFWKGDDLVQWTTTDGSAMVTMAGIMGVGDAAPLIGGMLIGAGMGAAISEQAGAGSGWDGGDWDDADWDDDWDDEGEGEDEDPDY